MIKPFINLLAEFSDKDFPIYEVSSLIQNSQFSEENIEQYSYFSKDCYTRNKIYKDKNFEVLLLCWLPGQMAPIHGHEGEKCWFKVIKGDLQINNYSIISESPLKLKFEKTINASAGYLDGPADVHSIKNCSNRQVKTLHIYARPYDVCDIYNIEEKRIERLKMRYHSIDGKLC